jgi:two-component system cell cycle sensor histidine kinase PleC
VLFRSIIIGSKKAEHFFEKQQELSVELVAARSSAEADSKSKSQFLANVTHELRTPLNAIIGFSEIISSEAMGPINNEQYKEFIKDIHTSGVHLLSLINDILDFSKAEANKLDVILEDLDLTKIATICLRMVSTRAEEAKVKLKEELPAEHILVKLDSKRVKQVILNLLSNAVKFTAENGDVTLKIGKNIELKEVLIQVRDTGIGMAPQDLARALAPFGQIDSKLSRKREGTGLGLPLTKKLVELMQGKFDIKSEVGIGTTVTLTFPLVLADIANSTPPPPTVKTTPTVS